MTVNNLKNDSLAFGINLFYQKEYTLARLELLEVVDCGTINEKVEANLYLGKIAFRCSEESFGIGENYMVYVIEHGNPFQCEQAYFELATKNRLLHHFPEAIRLYRKCLEIFPNDSYALTDLANLYLKLDELDKAYPLYLRLLSDDVLYKSKHKMETNNNIAYLGLAKINFRKGNITLFKEYFAKVTPHNKRDIEQRDDLEANLFFYYGQYKKAVEKLASSLNSDSNFIRKSAQEKVAIIRAIDPNVKADNKNLSVFFGKNPSTRAGSVTLANIYKQEKKYQLAYDLYISLACKEEKYLLDALNCAMYFDEKLAINIINRLIATNIDQEKYLDYLVYLKKKYGIEFHHQTSKKMPLVAEAFIEYDEEKVKNSAKYSCLLNFHEGYNWDYVYDSIIKSSLANACTLDNVEVIPGAIYDTYIINIPYLALDYKDYLVVKTYKGSKTPIEIMAMSKIELEESSPSFILRNDANVRKLFR